MKRTFTITVDIDDDDRVSEEDRVGEMGYWTDQITNAIYNVMRTYNNQRDNNHVDVEAIDITSITTSSTRDWEV